MKKIYLFILGAMSAGLLWSQGVKIGDTPGSPDPSAIFELESGAQGMLPPRMSTSQRDAIENPATGLTIFNTTTNCLNIRIGTIWKQVCPECDFQSPAAASNSPVCAGATLSLSASEIPGATYTWTGPDGFTSSDREPSIDGVTQLSSGAYSVSATIDGCTSRPTLTIVTVSESPETPLADSNSPVCSGGSLYLSASSIPGATYSWSGPDGFVSQDQNPAVTNPSPGTYTVYATRNTCASSISQTSVTLRSKSATGGSISSLTLEGIDYALHRFNSSDTFTPNECLTSVDVLVVGGGGGGAIQHSGGGGGGGVIYQTNYAIPNTPFNVVVGAGGINNSNLCHDCGYMGANGSNSVFYDLIALGGGGGGGWTEGSPVNGSNGGSGGGAGYGRTGGATGGESLSGQGNAGGNAYAHGPGGEPYRGSGGGGAGGPGGNMGPANGAQGGIGILNSITGTPSYYAGGGGGGVYGAGGQAGNGGLGGGGAGGAAQGAAHASVGATGTAEGAAGTPNTGGGGGSSGRWEAAAGNGGSGVVIVRYSIW